MLSSIDSYSTVLLAPAQMAAVDRAAIAGGVPGRALMENAGRAVADAIRGRWSPRPLLVLCGPGNNGGDGFVAARHLRDHGWQVSVALYGDAASLSGDAAFHAARWQEEILPFSTAALQGAELVLDAVFGAGLARDIPAEVMNLQQAVREKGLPVCAVDMPSGVDGADGRVKGAALAAAMTVTFFRKKPGHVLQPGRRLCGRLVVADIGIPEAVLGEQARAGMALDTYENDPACWLEAYPWPRADGHKYDRGHALIVGGETLTGAARLAAAACARMGAGLVTVAAPARAWPVYAAALTSVMAAPFDGADALKALLDDPRRNALLIGPGLGAGPQSARQVLSVLATERGVVLDADAISAFAEDPDRLFGAIRGPCVMTPHEGEFSRLFGGESGGKLERARRAARRSGAVIVLKGPDTIIAAPDGRAFINTNAPATLATGGTGDVLAGLIVGLMAQGMPALQAAAAAVWVHGDAAARIGLGLIADDLPVRVPQTLRGLRERVEGMT